MANIPVPKTIDTIRREPGRLAMVYSEVTSGRLYTHGHCNGREVVEYIDQLLTKISELENVKG